MSKPLLVIISGAPASGKTTLGRQLAAEFRLPFIGKDDIKEPLYDTLGTSNLEWSRKLGVATYHLLYYFVETQLRAGRSVIVESNFRKEFATVRFLDLQARYDYEPFQILCHADPRVLLERYRWRGASGERHPGHMDSVIYEELAATPNHGVDDYGILPIGGASIILDTTDLANLRYDLVAEALRAALHQAD